MIRALIVDDEPLAREGIRKRLSHEDDIEVVADAGDGPEAVEAIRKWKPDLLFLDIKLPGFDGFEVLERSSRVHLPVVIFVTAYDNYAIRAFESHALDYLLKPIDSARFHDALRRARTEMARSKAIPRQSIAHLLDDRDRGTLAPDKAPGGGLIAGRRFVVKDGERFILLKSKQIDWLQASANYVKFHVRDRSFMVRTTMNEVERKLEEGSFVRVHRSLIVNVDRIREIRRASHGDFEIVLRNGLVLPLSRRYREQLVP